MSSLKSKLGFFCRGLIVSLGIDRWLPPLVKGKSPRALVCRLIPEPGNYPIPTIHRIERNGINFQVDLSDHMQWLIYFGHEVENRNALYAIVKDKKQVLDVGANVGETALNISKILGANASVTAIEANPKTYTSLLHNCKLNPSLNVEPLNIGLSDKEGLMKVKRKSERNKGADQLTVITGTEKDSNDDVVNVYSIDGLISERRLSSEIDFIKIDVEGMELHVLKGASRLLEEHNPTLFFEYSEIQYEEFGYSGSDVFQYLSKFGYAFYEAGKMKEVLSNADIVGHTDIIAIRKN